MKNQLSRQGMLKVLLVAVIATYYSADFVNANHEQLHRSDLSSEVVGGTVNISAPPPADDSANLPPAAAARVVDQGTVGVSLEPVGTGMVNTPPPPPSAPPPAAVGDDNSTVLVSTADGLRSEMPKICGQRFYVSFREIPVNGTKLTEINIQPQTGEITGFQPITYRANGGFDLNLDRADVKQDLDGTIVSLVKKHLGHCDEAPVADRTFNNRTLAPQERESIQAGMKACRLNAHGEALSEVQATRCFIDQLSNLYVDNNANWAARDRAASQIEHIVRDNLKVAIKNRLMSRDDSKVDEGEELLDDTINSVNNATGEFYLDTYRMSHVVMELKALKAGGRTYRDASDLSAQIKDAQSDLRQQYAEASAYAQANPRDTYAQQRLTQAKYEIANREQLLQTQAQLAMTQGAYAELLADSRLGYVSATDFSQFSQPYQMVNADLTSLRGLVFGPNQQTASSLGAAGVALSQMPTDLLTYRQGLAQNFQSNFGTTVPQTAVSPALGMSNTGVTTAYTGITPPSLSSQIAPGSTFSPVTVIPVN